MESNLVQPWDRIDSRKNALNECPKRSKFLSAANLSSKLHGHVTKKGAKTKAEAWTGNKTGYSYTSNGFVRRGSKS